MPLDDTQGQYMKVRNTAHLTPAQRFRQQQALGQQEQALPVADKSMDVFPAMGEIAADIGGGIIEAPRQIVGGVLDATKELAQTLESIIPLGTLEGGEVTEESFLTTEEARTTTGGLVRGVSQFLTGFVPAMKGAKAIGVGGNVMQAMAAGAAADALVFDPQEERLSNLIESNPELSNPVTQYLASSPDDTDAEGRFKNALEGLALGGLTDSFFAGIKAMKAHRLSKLEADRLATEQAQIEQIADIAEPKAEIELDREVFDGLPAADESIEGEFIPFQEKIAPKDAPAFESGSTKAGEERAANINLNRINTTEDVEDLIDNIAVKEAEPINEARRQVITQQETEKLADDLGMSVEQLLARRKGEAFNAEQAVAARKLLVASGEKLIELAKIAKTGGDEDVAAFRRALAQHTAIQKQVSGLTAEAGRALQSFNIQARSAKEQERMISEALIAGGGIDNSRAMAAMMDGLTEPHQINTMADQLQKATTKDMVYEAWINGLLSSPTTHTVNMLSNTIVAAWSVGERKVANLIGDGLDTASVPVGEASAQAWGMVKGAKDGFRLAWHALKTGEPADVLTKIEVAEHKAITAENLGLSGAPGTFADYLGSIFRLPGRFLTAEDEFFKSIGYRMELNAQAYRTAASEGLEGDAMAKRIQDIIDNPPENIELEAITAMRYQTFTRELGETGKAVQSAIAKTPGARVIVPFIRTPTNIMKFVGERTPLAPLAQSVRDEIAAGGARRDLALAKMATGSMLMAVAADFTLSGDITGGGPKDPALKKIKMATGWQPYSLKVGDTYISYGRLDPIGATIGIAADAAEVMGQVSEAEALDLATAAVVAVAQNVTSKTYLSGLSEFFDVMSSTSADPEANNYRIKKWLERMAGSAVPAGVAQVERTVSPGLSATEGIIEKVKSRIPGLSEDLPPRRNIFGEPVILEGGIGPDIMSPIYASTDKKDKIADELVKQQTRISMPRQTINGVRLDSKQYDKYIRLYSGENNPNVDMPLKQKLRETFSSPLYKSATNGPEGGKSVIIRAIFDGYREAAKAEMIKSDSRLMGDIQAAQIDKAIKLGVGL
jgi:hypothetical protein